MTKQKKKQRIDLEAPIFERIGPTGHPEYGMLDLYTGKFLIAESEEVLIAKVKESGKAHNHRANERALKELERQLIRIIEEDTDVI